MTCAVAVLTYAHPDWLQDLLDSMRINGWPECPVRVFCDGLEHCGQGMAEDYAQICDRYRVPLRILPDWRCIQGNAQQAFEHSPEDWIICIQDDNLVPERFFLDACRTIRLCHDHPAGVGVLQPPVWHLSDWRAEHSAQDRVWFLSDLERVNTVALHPGWGQSPEPCTYIGAHGSCMIVRRAVWEEVGGFSPQTWRYDEELSGRCWLYTPWSIFQYNGPALVHGVPGMTLVRQQPNHSFSSADNFRVATGYSPDEWGRLQRQAMTAAGGDHCPLSRATPRRKGYLSS